MNRIQNNPYRIAGILSNATAREMQKQRGKIKAFASAKKEITSEFDFNFLSKIDRTEEVIGKAFSNIEQNQDKVNNSLFWFVNANPFDNTAIEYLKNGNSEKAQEIWNKVTTGKAVNSSNFSAFNNIGTLLLLSKTKSEIKAGIEAKIKLIESEYFENFVHSVADQTFTIDNKKQSKLLVDELLTQFKNQYSSADALDLFSNCGNSTQNYLSTKFTEEPLHNIESSIEATKKKRSKNKADAYSFGLKLFVDSKDDLQLLKSLLGSSDLKYKMTADNIAKEVMECSVTYFNKSQEDNSSKNYLEEAMKLVRLADSIAVSQYTKDKAKDHLSSLAEMKDKEINKAIAVLKSIKDAYEIACKQIDKQVDDLEYNTIPGYGGAPPTKLRRFDVVINWSKVEKMKRDALDWNKVVSVINKEIHMQDIIKIKHSSNQSMVSNYKSLIDFLFSKLGPVQINQVKHICYWKDVRTAQAKSTGKEIKETSKAVLEATGEALNTLSNATGGASDQLVGMFVLIVIMLIIAAIGSLFG